MKKTLFTFLGVILLLLTACAGLDQTVLDTAETLGKGAVSVSQAQTMGMKMPEWVRIDPENIYDSDSAYALQYSELKLGLTDDMDLSIRGGIEDYAFSGKLLLKKQVSKTPKYSSAIVFGAGGMKANEKFWEHPIENTDVEIDYQVLSADLQYLYTAKITYDSYVTLAGIYSVHSYKEEFMDGTSEEFFVYNAGLRANAKYIVPPFYGIFELGVEAPLSIEGFTGVYPWVGMKAGIEINTKK